MKITVSVTDVNIDIPKHIGDVQSAQFWTFAATEWHRLYEPFVPYHEGVLANTVVIIGGRGNGSIEHTVPYARYQYYGNAYGPSYPLMRNGVIVGYRSPAGKPKHPTGKKLVYKRDQHPLASAMWDQAARPTQLPKLIRSMQHYIDSGRL